MGAEYKYVLSLNKRTNNLQIIEYISVFLKVDP